MKFSIVKEGVSVKDDDIIFIYTSENNQLMDGSVPWRGAQEKHRDVYQMFIESLTKLGGVVVDVTASTCTFSSGSLLAKIVEHRAIKNRVYYIHC